MNQQFTGPSGKTIDLDIATERLIEFACKQFVTTPEKLLDRTTTPRPIEKLALVAFLMSVDLKLSDAAIARRLRCAIEDVPRLCGYISLALVHDDEIANEGMAIRDELLDDIEPGSDKTPSAKVTGQEYGERAATVLDAIQRVTELSLDDIRRPGKLSKPSAARSIGYLLLTTYAELKLGEAGKLLGRNEPMATIGKKRMKSLWRANGSHWQCILFRRACEALGVSPSAIIPPHGDGK